MNGDIVTRLLLDPLIESRQESCVCACAHFSRPSRSPLSLLVVAWTSLASVGKVMALDWTVSFTVTRFTMRATAAQPSYCNFPGL